MAALQRPVWQGSYLYSPGNFFPDYYMGKVPRLTGTRLLESLQSLQARMNNDAILFTACCKTLGGKL